MFQFVRLQNQKSKNIRISIWSIVKSSSYFQTINGAFKINQKPSTNKN